MIDAVVLAAGLGTRMRESKPLTRICGSPSLTHVLRALRDAKIHPIHVVLGRDAEMVRESVALDDVQVIVNPSPQRGLSSSLSLGIDAVHPNSEGALLVLADMPAIRPSTIRSVADRGASGAPLVAPSYQGIRGFPVYIRRDHFDALLDHAKGDVGARSYLSDRAEALTLIPVDDPGCIKDFDRPQDLMWFERSLPCSTSA